MSWPLSIAVYAAGAAVNGVGALQPQIERQLAELGRYATNRAVAALSELGTEDRRTVRSVLDPAGRFPPQVGADTNFGDPAQLGSFVEWATGICPADRLLLVLSGHGMAWEDGTVDQLLGTVHVPASSRAGGLLTRKPGPAVVHSRGLFGVRQTPVAEARAVLVDGTDRDYLSNAELGAACARIAVDRGGPIDCLLLDACLMSSWELLQELQGSVATAVASIDELSAAGVPYGAAAYDLSVAGGVLRPEELATTVVSRYRPAASFDTCVAVDLREPFATAMQDFTEFCRALYGWLGEDPANVVDLRRALRIASASVVRFDSGSIADFRAFHEAATSMRGLPSGARKALDQVLDDMSAVVLRSVTGSDYRDALGLSLFCPASEDVYRQNRPDYVRLQFALLTGWAAVLDTVFGYRDEVVAAGLR